ncbi:TPR repeat [Alkalimonas amylolytica]|uniref:TPR repeat n=2 Tax=Alkalimonas amylolytica TaxID=152573 RepID=A0A1H4F1P1_ALKAM|nr:TPR repeat [Alkalimonas amylolytica]
MKIKKVFFSFLLLFVSPASIASDCNSMADKRLAVISNCYGSNLSYEEQSACDDDLSNTPPTLEVQLLSDCIQKNMKCLERWVQLVINYQLVNLYDIGIDLLSSGNFPDSFWIQNSLASFYILRGKDRDYAAAEVILATLIDDNNRLALGNLAELKILKQEYEDALKIFEYLRLNQIEFEKDHDNLLRLAQLYHFGSGSFKQWDKAEDLYLRALPLSSSGHAEYLLADILLKSDRVEAGLIMLDKAIDKGSVNAAEMLASFFWEGIHVEKNTRKAFKYFQVASKLGSVSALYNQGIIYNQLKEYRKMKIAFYAAAVFGDENAIYILEKNGEIVNNHICDVRALFSRSDNFLFYDHLTLQELD